MWIDLKPGGGEHGPSRVRSVGGMEMHHPHPRRGRTHSSAARRAVSRRPHPSAPSGAA